MTIINGRPVSQQVWHTEEPSLLNGAMSAEYRSKYATFAGNEKNLEWGGKQINTFSIYN